MLLCDGHVEPVETSALAPHTLRQAQGDSHTLSSTQQYQPGIHQLIIG